MSGVSIVGVGIHPFGRFPGRTAQDHAIVAVRAALADAGVRWGAIDFAAGGTEMGANPDTLVTHLGLTGVPFVNVKNGCATGGSALAVASAMIESGRADIALAVGFDKHPRGAFNQTPEAWGLPSWYGTSGMMLTTQFFAMKLRRYMHEYDIPTEVLAAIAEKAYANGELNENAFRRTPLDREQIADAQMVNDPLTQFMFCSPVEGAVAVVLASSERAKAMRPDPVHLRAVTFRTRHYGSVEVFAPGLSADRGDGPTIVAARDCFEEAGIGPDDVDVAQIQDTEAGAELMHMAETGLCAHGQQEALVLTGATRVDGALPINTDGGCIANGEPIGATALRQIHENVLQLRGEAGERQVLGDPQVAFSHVYGAPGVSLCTVMTR